MEVDEDVELDFLNQQAVSNAAARQFRRFLSIYKFFMSLCICYFRDLILSFLWLDFFAVSESLVFLYFFRQHSQQSASEQFERMLSVTSSNGNHSPRKRVESERTFEFPKQKLSAEENKLMTEETAEIGNVTVLKFKQR